MLSTQQARFLWLCGAALSFLFKDVCDEFVQALWARMRESAVVKHDTWEPCVAVLGFVFAINFWRMIDTFEIAQKYRINPQPKQKTSWTQGSFLSKLDDLPFPLRLPAKAVVYVTPTSWRGVSVLAYLLPLFIFDTIYPRRQLPVQAPTFFGLIGGLVASIWAYDFVMFWLHLALHKSPFLFRAVHSKHHRQKVLSACEVVRHSFADGSLQVVSNIIALNLLRSHPLTRMVHNLVVTYLLTEAHSGYDMPFMLQHVIPFGIYGGSTKHEVHHRVGGTIYLQQLFAYLDTILGFVPEAA